MDKRILTLNFKDSLSALSDLMMPRVCLVCGRELTLREKLLCLPCSLDLPFTRFENWEHNPMANKYNERIGLALDQRCPVGTGHDGSVTTDPQNVTPDPIGGLYEPYQRAAALLYYWHGSGYANIPQSLKYGRNFEAGRHFGAMLGRRLAASPLFADVELVVPVPLHWTRRLRRGYNQAEVIARAIARELSSARASDPAGAGASAVAGAGLPESKSARAVVFAPRLLRRVRRTRTQTRMTISEKSLNVSGAFEVRKSVLKKYIKEVPSSNSTQPVHTLTDSVGGMCKKGQKRTYPRLFSGGYAQRNSINDLKGLDNAKTIHHILLVDDVFTTGSTLTACHDALRKVFGPDVRISLATLSFAG